MYNFLVDPVKSLSSWLRRRWLSPLKVHVQKARVAGEQEKPALVITMIVENPQSENSFVKEFEVRMIQPFQAMAVRYEFRDPRAESNTKTLPLNIPSFGVSEALSVIAHFDQNMASPNGQYRASIAAIGRDGFRRRHTEFGGDCPW